MKYFFILYLFAIIFISCRQTGNNDLTCSVSRQDSSLKRISQNQDLVSCELLITSKQIDDYCVMIDSLISAGTLTKQEISGMTVWGRLSGFYKNKELMLIVAKYSAELGFTKRKFYLYKGQFCKFYFQRHIAEWSKYREKYPKEVNTDPKKTEYQDSVYIVNMDRNFACQRKCDMKLFSTKMDTVLTKKLIQEGQKMKKYLERENISR